MSSFWHKAAFARAASASPAESRATRAQLTTGQDVRKSIRRNPAPLAPDLRPTDDLLRLRLAEELDYARRLLALMGEELAGDAPVVVRHGQTLQSIDIVGQMIGHVAAVVRSCDPPGAVERIGMAEMKSRLTRGSIG